MRQPKWYDFISDWVNDVEWYFAKRWLNKTFGYKEYWGDYIQHCLCSDQAKKNPDHFELDHLPEEVAKDWNKQAENLMNGLPANDHLPDRPLNQERE